MTRFDPKIRAEAVSLLKEVFVILEQHGRREQPSPQQPQRRRKSRKPSPVRIALGVVKWIFITLWTVLLIGVCTALVGLHFFKEYIDTVVTPNVAVRAEDYTMKLSSFIYYQDKETGSWKELQSVHGAENRILVEFKDMSPYLWQAAVSIEDERFFKHQGVDWKRTLGAVKELITGDGSYGGSTITQQVLKNMTKDNKPYVNRKVREIFRALEFEKNYGKEYILEQYLNDIYLGQGCYGVQTAAQFYFGKDAKDLSLAESACIIAITNNPSLYGPLYDVTYTREDGTKVTPRELNKNRQETILNKMCDERHQPRDGPSLYHQGPGRGRQGGGPAIRRRVHLRQGNCGRGLGRGGDQLLVCGQGDPGRGAGPSGGVQHHSGKYAPLRRLPHLHHPGPGHSGPGGEHL